jgi:hypothetical protein
MTFKLNPYTMIWRADPVRFPLPVTTKGRAALRDAVPRFTLLREGCCGAVGEDWVRLRYQRPLSRNGFAPMLDARLLQEQNAWYLSGVYRMTTYGRLFMTVWFSFLLLMLPFFLVTGAAGLASGGEVANAGFLVVPLLMVAFGLAFLNFGQRGWNEEKRLIEQWIVQHSA